MTNKTAKKSHVWDIDPHNWYVEPKSSTEQLLSVETFHGVTYDPSCGQGNIVKTFIENGHKAIGTDIVDRVSSRDHWFMGRRDYMENVFMDDFYMGDVDNTVMNPPFYRAKGSEAFIRRALDTTRFKVAAFVDVKFLGSAGRAKGLFNEYPPTRVWIISPRPSCPPGAYLQAGNKAGGGTADWVWIVWDKTVPFTGTAFGWLKARLNDLHQHHRHTTRI